MQKHLGTQRTNAPVAQGLSSGYRPAIDANARRLIARIQQNSRDTEAVLELQAHYDAHGDYPSLANLLEGWAKTLSNDRHAAAAYFDAGEAVLVGMGDRARSQRLYQQALDRYPEHDGALARIEAMLREDGDDTALERCLSQLIQELTRRDADPKFRAKLHLRLGQLYEERLLLRGRAIAQYRSALELDATLVPAIAAARGIYLNSGKSEAAADMFELQIAATPEATDRHALLVGLARHRRHALGDLDGAVLALRRAVKTLPAEPPTFEMLAELLAARSAHGGEDAPADRARAAELYYQVARSIPRNQARPRLEACLTLQPDHVRARRMLDELNAYGAGAAAGVEPGDSVASQAEIEQRATGAYPPAATLRPGQTLPGPGILPRELEPPTEDVAEEDIAAWLDDEEVTLLEDGVGTQNMVPLSDRPPPN
jgi:tetratricopeptide (TPR) repeat protein